MTTRCSRRFIPRIPSATASRLDTSRRSGTTWFLAVLCGPAPKNLRIPLSFLGAGMYTTTVVGDDTPDGATVKVAIETDQRTDTISLDLRAGGGFIARFIQ